MSGCLFGHCILPIASDLESIVKASFVIERGPFPCYNEPIVYAQYTIRRLFTHIPIKMAL